MTDPRPAVAYYRVSTGEQAESGLGLAAQREAVRRAAERDGFVVVAEFEDAGISGSAGVEDRPGLAAALDAMEQGGALLVAKRDRLGRDVMLNGWLELEAARKGAAIHSAAGEGNGTADDPAAKLMRHMVDAFAEYERNIIRARTKAALAAKRRDGRRFSRHAPWGYRIEDGRLVADDHERSIARWVADQLQTRRVSLRQLARELDARGERNRNGRTFTHATIRRIAESAQADDTAPAMMETAA